MASNGKSGDPGKFYSLFGGPESYQTYGPGQADYITVPGPNQTGPLINIPSLLPGASRGDVEGIFGKRKIPSSLPPRGRATAQLPSDTRTDGMEIRVKEGAKKPASPKQPAGVPDPASSTPSVQGTKGDMLAPSSDPLSMMAQAFMSLFAGGLPNSGMGGGTTEAPLGSSPFTQMPTMMDLPERNPFQQGGPDEEILANMIRGPGQSQEMTSVPPMMQEAAKARAAPLPMAETPATPAVPAMNPGVPSPNPAFHAQPNSLEALLTSMFQAGVPERNPLFTGGV